MSDSDNIATPSPPRRSRRIKENETTTTTTRTTRSSSASSKSAIRRRRSSVSRSPAKKDLVKKSSRALAKTNTAVLTASQAKAEEGKMKKIFLRLFFGLLMIGTFLGIIYTGHIYAWLLVVVLQALIFRELVQVRYIEAADRKLPWFRTIQWCWFGVAMMYNYGDSLYEFVKRQEGVTEVPTLLVQYLVYNPWISFTLYALLFVLSVLSLKQGYYKYQMSNFTWTMVTIGLIVGQMKYVMNNIFNGFFWFVFPASLVICNDCFAYFCGRSFGRKFVKATFLKISPNKTWEGFIGAFFCTLVFGFFYSHLLSQYTWMVCPLEKFQLINGPLTCQKDLIFMPHTYEMPAVISSSFLQLESLTLLPIQLHSFVFSTFISLIAPFGGFFASAVKRTYNLKDFDSTIPGHGGFFDRMDCQLITGLFTAVYYTTFCQTNAAYATVPRVMLLISMMSAEDKALVLQKLQQELMQ